MWRCLFILNQSPHRVKLIKMHFSSRVFLLRWPCAPPASRATARGPTVAVRHERSLHGGLRGFGHGDGQRHAQPCFCMEKMTRRAVVGGLRSLVEAGGQIETAESRDTDTCLVPQCASQKKGGQPGGWCRRAVFCSLRPVAKYCPSNTRYVASALPIHVQNWNYSSMSSTSSSWLAAAKSC
jgi:hypothetical protein